MPAKKNSTAGVEEEAPVKTPINPVEDRLVTFRDERRALEAELAVIDEQIRTAINSGDLENLDKFAARKAELPRLYIAASTAEMAARQAIFSAEDKDSLARLRAAEDRRDELQAALVKMKERHREELAALEAELQAAITEVGATYSTIQSARNLSESCDAGFKRAMAGITRV
jgi:chromosome segregation ATPase